MFDSMPGYGMADDPPNSYVELDGSAVNLRIRRPSDLMLFLQLFLLVVFVLIVSIPLSIWDKIRRRYRKNSW